MKRVVVFLLSLGSLLACAGFCVLWVRSHRTPANQVAGRDVFNVTREDPRYWFISGPGYLTFCRQEGKNWDHPLKEHELLGVRFGGLWGPDGSLLWNLDLPYWLLVTATALPGTVSAGWWLRRRRRVRAARRLGLCLTCGYDLRESPGACPECGAAAPNLRSGRHPSPDIRRR